MSTIDLGMFEGTLRMCWPIAWTCEHQHGEWIFSGQCITDPEIARYSSATVHITIDALGYVTLRILGYPTKRPQQKGPEHFCELPAAGAQAASWLAAWCLRSHAFFGHTDLAGWALPVLVPDDPGERSILCALGLWDDAGHNPAADMNSAWVIVNRLDKREGGVEDSQVLKRFFDHLRVRTGDRWPEAFLRIEPEMIWRAALAAYGVDHLPDTARNGLISPWQGGHSPEQRIALLFHALYDHRSNDRE